MTQTRALHLGRGLSLPLDAVTRRIGILGMSGSGKTTTARKLVEELLRLGLPVRAIDPKDDLWGLKSSADGKEVGYPITVFGGAHGDLPHAETGGKVLAEIPLDEIPQMVISLAHFSKSAMKRFMIDYCETLYHRNREALHFVLDEADLFAPQRLGKGDALRLFGAVDDIVRRGRKRGIGVTMICQRSADINKDILTQCDLLVAHRATHQLDQEPVTAWMRAARMPPEKLKDVDETIAKLNDGEAWVMSPQWLKRFERVRIAMPWTFDSGATPEAGKKIHVPKALAKVDLEALQKKMASTIERAKAQDPRALQKQIAELQEQIRGRDAGWVTGKAAKNVLDLQEEIARLKAQKVKIMEVPVLSKKDMKRLESAVTKIEKHNNEITKQLEEVDRIRDRLAQAQQIVVSELGSVRAALKAAEVMKFTTADVASPPTSVRGPAPFVARTPTPFVAAPIAAPAAPKAADPDFALTGSHKKILEQLVIKPGLSRRSLALRAGYTPGTGRFNNLFYGLTGNGYVVIEGERCFATKTGAEAVPDARPMSPLELRAMWQQKLTPSEWKLVEVALTADAGGVTPEDLALATGYTPGTGRFNNLRYTLTGKGLLVSRTKGGPYFVAPELVDENAGLSDQWVAP